MGGHQNDPVSQEDRLLDAVGDVDHGLAGVLPQADQLSLEDGPGLGIQGAEGLIHEEDLRIVREGPGNAHPLLHAAGELVGIGIGKLRQAHLPDPVAGRLPPFCPGNATHFQAERHIVQDRLPGEDGIFLKDDVLERHLLTPREKVDPAGTRRDEPPEDPEKGRFPAAGGTHDADEFPFLHAKGEVAQGAHQPITGWIPLRQIPCLDLHRHENPSAFR